MQQIHFAHANGIPTQVYQKLLSQLKLDFDVISVAELGTDPKFPVTNHWKLLQQQVEQSIVTQMKNNQPVIGVGHSLGGLLTLMLAYRRPELFKQLILLDPPAIMGKFSLALHLGKIFAPKQVDRLTPAGISMHRRDHWNSREQAAESLISKPFFQAFDPQCFEDYIAYGLKDAANGGVELTIPKSVEVEVFRTNPSMFWLKPRRPPQIPVTILVGKDSLFYKKGFTQIINKQLEIPYQVVEGGHMFPLEYPDRTVKDIKQLIL